MKDQTANLSPNKLRLHQLTSVRFVAAFIVTLHHFGGNTRLVDWLPGAFFSGPAMVTLFFVLSGMVLWIAYEDKEIDRASFYFNRSARIFPVYYLRCLLLLFRVP